LFFLESEVDKIKNLHKLPKHLIYGEGINKRDDIHFYYVWLVTMIRKLSTNRHM